MATNPIHDLIDINKIVKSMTGFNPKKKDSIADFLKEINDNIEKLNDILKKYFS